MMIVMSLCICLIYFFILCSVASEYFFLNLKVAYQKIPRLGKNPKVGKNIILLFIIVSKLF